MADATLVQTGTNIGQLAQVTNGQITTETVSTGQEDEEPTIDIQINNVVCSFSTRCHLNLKKLAMEGTNVEYHRQHGMLNMRIRRPFTTASIWSSGKITCTGATSEDFSKIAARKFARKIQKLGFKVRFSNFRVVNVLGTCAMPFSINITEFARQRKEARYLVWVQPGKVDCHLLLCCLSDLDLSFSETFVQKIYPLLLGYEPELHPGVTYKIKNPKATLKIFSTGSITVTAPRVANVQSAIEFIYPMLCNFKAGPRRETQAQRLKHKHNVHHNKQQFGNIHHYNFADEEEDFDSEYDSEEDDFESD